MPDENVFDLPHPEYREAPFQLLVLQRLDQIGEALAQIHQMVSPPEKGAARSARSFYLLCAG
ncbi:hypothetical protein [Gluconobacter wancherniae]|uniref:hypothetical protein n=1 Tax=Gluconobacter wancherniae TaxID=1307955 RepID=UPI001B8D0164|nr:hypothetical protein [Gluconobacter wancherniae]MBS1089864.1 hypothetical protein [Gluconobacter wancherniae]